MAPQPITIVGGGIAGLTLGIGLRQMGVPVAIYEAGTYPRHRVCGEFISGEGLATLTRLGLRDLLNSAGAVKATTAAFFSASRATAPYLLPAPALCLSRFALDAVLADRFRELGGDLRVLQRAATNQPAEGWVLANGRRAETQSGTQRWFGLKIHAREVALTADLEMHFSPHGYVGLCHLGGGETNVCGLFRKSGPPGYALPNWRALLMGEPGSLLNRRLAPAKLERASFCSVAGISLQPKRATARREMVVGDAMTMIPPLTGNGMSMAFESAERAIIPLTAWSRKEVKWEEARRTLAKTSDAVFTWRLAWAQWLQRLVLMPALQNPLVNLAGGSDWFRRMAFAHTR